MHWLVGDIQGCVREFELLLKAIAFRPQDDELWCLGDLVNRGPESAQTLRLWTSVGGKAVLGNHDLYAIGVFRGQTARRSDTLDDLLAASDAEQLLGRLAEMPILASVNVTTPSASRRAWLVHAGLDPRRGDDLDALALELERKRTTDLLKDRDIAFATRVRCCDPQGEMARGHGPPEDALPPYAPWDHFYAGADPVFHGHWAARGFHRTGKVTGLDSGCVYGRQLTAWCLEEDRAVSVDAVRSFGKI